MTRLLVLQTILCHCILVLSSDCIDQNFCNGHGTCMEATSSCSCQLLRQVLYKALFADACCFMRSRRHNSTLTPSPAGYDGWGSEKDVAVYKAHDCSLRTCPSGRAWADLPTESNRAHAPAECSNKGLCNRETGVCECYPGFTGDACQRRMCVNDCSGHGKCVSMKRMASMSNALPLSAATTYSGNEDTTRWDQNMIFGCVCDSSWEVGLGAGQRQEPEWFGYDCSKRHCPSGDNPYTIHVDETNCTNIVAVGGYGAGDFGNICQVRQPAINLRFSIAIQVDCANRGICDFQTGVCNCFAGSYGHDCTLLSALAV